MSYTIVYERQFLKTGDGRYIALVLMGSNNCYQQTCSNRWKRERNWNPILASSGGIANGNIAVTEEEMLRSAEKRCGSEFQEHFKWRGKWVNDKGWMSFVKNGIKDAMTIEEIDEASHYDMYLRCYLSIWYTDGETYAGGGLKQKNKEELRCTASTSEELIAFLAAADERLARKSDNENFIYICMEFPSEKAIMCPKNPKPRRTPERLDEFYAVKLTSGGYIRQLTSRTLRRAFSTQAAKQFKTEGDALKWLNKYRIADRFSVSFDVEHITEHINI